MKIAQIAPIGERVPPKKYGGTERVVHALTEELVKRGHEVTLFASGDSQTSAKLVSVFPTSLRESHYEDFYGTNFWSMLNIGNAYLKQDKFDIIHDHNEHFSLPTANLATTPVVMTLHSAFNSQNKKLYETLNNVNFVSISHSQAIPAPSLNYVGNVHHGMDMRHYRFSRENDGYLLFVGRMNPEKGVHHAVAVAEYLGLPLIIAAKLDKSRIEQEYYKKMIEPRLNDQIRWIGEVAEDERNKLMSRALCMLHPVTWREPFGLTLIEAMACGAPVVAFNRGSIKEIIFDKKTGYVVEDEIEMIEAIKQIDKIKRIDCRNHALENFSAERMADGYEAIYEKVLADSKKKKVDKNGNGYVTEKVRLPREVPAKAKHLVQ
jgi:glycosyltransferase involved in cell wall biosynthesis